MSHLDRNILTQTDEEIEAAFNERGVALCVEDLAFVTDTIDDFMVGRRDWRESGRVIERTPTSLVIEGVQPRKGVPRRTLIVVDFGAARAVDGFIR